MPGMRKGVQTGRAYRCYGDNARKVEIGALREHRAFIMVLRKGVPKDEAFVNGRFV